MTTLLIIAIALLAANLLLLTLVLLAFFKRVGVLEIHKMQWPGRRPKIYG